MLDVKGLPKLKSVRVAFDGDDVTGKATRSGDKLTFTTGKLSDGSHSVSFNATSSNLLRHEVRKDWRFTVDTSIPTLELAGSADEGRINTSPATFSGTTEPYSHGHRRGRRRQGQRPGRRQRQVHGERQAARRTVGRHHHAPPTGPATPPPSS